MKKAHPLCSCGTKKSAMAALPRACVPPPVGVHPASCPSLPQLPPCPGSRNKQGASHNPPALQSVWSSSSPLVLMCLCARVCAHACTPVWERDVFVGSSFGIWFSTHFFVNFCHFSFSALISYQSSSLL